MPQFIEPYRPRDGITKMAEYRGYVCLRRDPHGFWEAASRLDDAELPEHYKQKYFTTLQTLQNFIDQVEPKQ